MELRMGEFKYDHSRDATVDGYLKNFDFLGDLKIEERDIFYWVNVLRTDPNQFLNKYVLPFLDQFPEAKGSAAKSLIGDLKKQASLPMMEPRLNLTNASRKHAKDLALNSANISHSSTDGKSFSERMAAEGIVTCAGENILIGDASALKALILLLIDEGVSNRGHRKALLNSEFNLIGASMYPRKDGMVILDQLFSCK